MFLHEVGLTTTAHKLAIYSISANNTMRFSILIIPLTVGPVFARRGSTSDSVTSPTKMPQQGILDEHDFPYGWGLEDDICLLGAPYHRIPRVKEVKRCKNFLSLLCPSRLSRLP